MSPGGELNQSSEEIECGIEAMQRLADACSLPVLFFVWRPGMESPAVSYMNVPAQLMLDGDEEFSSGLSFLATQLFGPEQSAEMMSAFLEKGEFRGRVRLRPLREGNPAEVALRRLDAGTSVHLSAMIVDAKSADGQLLSHYPEMLRRFELSYDMARHDMQNHITALSSYLGLCIRDDNAEARNQHLARMSAIVQDMTKYVRNMGTVSAGVTRSEQRRRLDDIVLSGFAGVAMEGVNVNLDCEGIELPSDPLLPVVFYNLAYNSLSHGKHIRNINVSCEHGPDAVRIIYRDDGPGIDPALRTELFAPPSEGGKQHALFLIRQILLLHGWTISERGSPGNGARFEISMPDSRFRTGGAAGPGI